MDAKTNFLELKWAEIVYLFFLSLFGFILQVQVGAIALDSRMCSICDWTEPMRKAEAFFDTRQYPEAEEIYLNLLKSPLQPWQRAQVLYNLGCIALETQEHEKAIAIFNEVPLNEPLKPLLSYKIFHNLSIAYLRKKTENQQDAIRALNHAFQYAEKAEIAYCALQKAEGMKLCTPNKEERLKKAIKERLQFNQEWQEQQQNQPIPSKEGLHQQEIKKPIDKVLQKLLEMEQQDRVEVIESKANGQVLRPW